MLAYFPVLLCLFLAPTQTPIFVIKTVSPSRILPTNDLGRKKFTFTLFVSVPFFFIYRNKFRLGRNLFYYLITWIQAFGEGDHETYKIPYLLYYSVFFHLPIYLRVQFSSPQAKCMLVHTNPKGELWAA